MYYMNKLLRRLKRYFIPHAGNNYKPGIFVTESVAAILFVLCIVEGAFFFQTNVALRQSGFLASVLPAAVMDLTNGDRAKNEAAALTTDPLLTQAAQNKADDMATKGYFAHVSPDGKTPWYWLDAVGYHYSYAGENLAINFSDSEDVESAWMNSPEHRANIVKPQYTKIGVGVAEGMYQGKETTFVVELFAAQPEVASAAPTPQPTSVTQQATAPASATAVPAQSKVLGAQTSSQSPTVVGFIATGATSPLHVTQLILAVFVVIVAILLGFVVFVKAGKRKRYLEEVGGGLVLIGVAAALIVFNTQSAEHVQIPASNQPASVSLAL
jgi:preprotein translocase subunit SecG